MWLSLAGPLPLGLAGQRVRCRLVRCRLVRCRLVRCRLVRSSGVDGAGN